MGTARVMILSIAAVLAYTRLQESIAYKYTYSLYRIQSDSRIRSIDCLIDRLTGSQPHSVYAHLAIHQVLTYAVGEVGKRQ